MDRIELRKHIEQQLSKYEQGKKDYKRPQKENDASRSTFLRRVEEIVIGALAIIAVIGLRFSTDRGRIGAVSMIAAGLLWFWAWFTSDKQTEERNKKILQHNKELYKKLIGIDYNPARYGDIDYIISVLSGEHDQKSNTYTDQNSTSTKSTLTSKSASDNSGNKPNGKKRCPKCGSTLVRRKGPYGAFWGCSNYPRCHYTKSIKR